MSRGLFLVSCQFLLVSALFSHSAHAQAIFDAQAIRGLSAGMGSGMAASLGNGKAVQRSYEKMAEAQQAAVALTKAIDTYVANGISYEQKKEWVQAEKCFRYVLQLIARRDGPGSKNSVPVLKHLVRVNKEQNKLDDAISFQKTVVAFTQADKKPDHKVLLREQQELSGFYLKKQDYASAAPVLKASYALCEGTSTIAPTEQQTVRVQYADVLRKLSRHQEADAIARSAAAAPAATAAAVSAPRSAVPAARPAGTATEIPMPPPPPPLVFEEPAFEQATPAPVEPESAPVEPTVVEQTPAQPATQLPEEQSSQPPPAEQVQEIAPAETTATPPIETATPAPQSAETPVPEPAAEAPADKSSSQSAEPDAPQGTETKE